MKLDSLNCPELVAKSIQTLSDKIDFERMDDKGGSGFTFFGRNRLLDRKLVVKFYFWNAGAHPEPKLLSDLACDHVLRVEDAAAIDKENAYFITPFCEEGDLDDVISGAKTGLRRSVDMVLDISKGVNFIHSKGYIHRDLKPSNIFCELDGKLVIGDFGSVVKRGADGYAEIVSTHSLLYRTPEEIRLRRAYPQGDIYQIGVVLYQLLGGIFPYDGKFWLNKRELERFMTLSSPENQIFINEVLQKKIVNGRLIDIASLPAWVPSKLVSIIRRCCKVSHSERFDNVADLIGALSNIRSTIPDWRFAPEPILYKRNKKIRIMEKAGQFWLEKMVGDGEWRKIHAVKIGSIQEAVLAVEQN